MTPFTHVWDEAKFLKIGHIPLEIQDICWWRFTCWKWKISNFVEGLSFHLGIAKVKYLRNLKHFLTKCPLSTRWRWSKVVWQSFKYLSEMLGYLPGQFTCSKWEISNLVDGLSFHLVIAKVKYLRTWNFRPKCPPSTRLRWMQSFWKSVKYLWRYGIFAEYSLQVESGKFQILSMG